MMNSHLTIKLLFRSMFVMSLFLIVFTSQIQAARITENDCGIGGVKAGWNSTHHYLPEKFNKTGLKEVNWLESKINIPLDRYPTNYVVGYGAIPCERITLDNTIALYGTYTKQGHNATADIITNIFQKDPLYISCISVAYLKKMNKSFKMLATDLETPRGIKLMSSVDDVLRSYGNPDYITEFNNGNGKYYWYYTPNSLQIRKNNKGYKGACIIFSIQNNAVQRITVYNTYGYR